MTHERDAIACICEQCCAAQANRRAKIAQARPVVECARAGMGHHLGGFSMVDLLADNFPWSLEQCRQIAAEFEPRRLVLS